MVKYNLVGVDGNAFCIMGYVTRSMKKEGKTDDEINGYREIAMSGDYTNLLNVSQDVIEHLNRNDLEEIQ